VVHDVTCPEDPDLVVCAVVPVVDEVVGEEQGQPGERVVRRQVHRSQQVGAGIGGQGDELPSGVDDDISDTHGKAGPGVARLVTEFVVVGQQIERSSLKGQADHEEGDGEDDQFEHGRFSVQIAETR